MWKDFGANVVAVLLITVGALVIWGGLDILGKAVDQRKADPPSPFKPKAAKVAPWWRITYYPQGGHAEKVWISQSPPTSRKDGLLMFDVPVKGTKNGGTVVCRGTHWIVEPVPVGTKVKERFVPTAADLIRLRTPMPDPGRRSIPKGPPPK